MNWHFENTETLIAFLLIPIVIFLFWQLLQWKKKAIRSIGNPKIVQSLFRNFSEKNFRLKFILCCIALSLLVLGASNLRHLDPQQSIERAGIDIVIALDLSNSMLADDERPTRLDRAKIFLEQFIQSHPNDRIAWVFFAGRAYVQMPLTHDHAAALTYLQQAHPDNITNKGTNIADALRTGFHAFQQQDIKNKTILLVTDGEEHDENAAALAKELSSNGVMVHSIGVGTPAGVNLKSYAGSVRFDKDGNPIVSKLNEKLLKQIAANTNGTYNTLDNFGNAIKSINSQIAGIEKTPLVDKNYTNYTTYFQYFLFVAFILLAIELFIPEKKVKWLF
ncbi:vWA domain-containing protein [Gynurincola endophyticus]|uniref:vWA domain-containing protein n=1 Tax=Gynurincola endophyticus TaxID=2479004 RepID=UPI000F8C68E5|nr:VWA domain-containing protein [Gynurincola endophyticus]